MKKHCRRSAISFIELIIVVLVMAIISSVGSSRFFDAWQRSKVDMAARRLACELNWAQDYARKTGLAVTVTLDMANNNCRIQASALPGVAPALDSVVNFGESMLQTNLAAISLSDSGRIVSFNGLGFPAQGGTITLRSGSHTKNVTVERSSGLASVP